MGASHNTCVFWASQEGRATDLTFHLDCVTSKKEALSLTYSDKKWTPMHAAVSRGHQQCVRILWEAGSKLDAQDKDGYTPIHLAANYQHLYCLRLLVQLGASIGAETKFGVTPLHLGASVGNSVIVEELVKLGAYIDAQESWGQTPLIIAATKSRLHTMATLLRLGANTEIKDYHHGYTALHVAVNTRDEENVLVMLDAGASLNSTDKEGLSPLGLALRNRFYRVVPLLVEYGGRLTDGDRVTLPIPLQEYIDKKADTPLTLQQQSRVNVRKSLGPSQVDQLSDLGLEPEFEAYVRSILDLCDGSEVKQVAVHAQAKEQKGKVPFEQFDVDSSAFKK